MEDDFNVDVEYIRRKCQPRERVQSDSNKPFFPEKNFLDICLEGANELEKDKALMDAIRDSLR